jgi:hypothetical protein
MKELDELLAAFERLLQICHEALSPTATARQKSEARAVINDWLKSRA